MVFLFLGIFSFIITIAGISIFAYARSYLKTQLSEITQKERRIVIDLLKKHVKEINLLEESRILILNKKGTNIDNRFSMILKRFTKTPNEEQIIDLPKHNFKFKFENYDVVIFDNTNTQGRIDNWDFDNNIEDKKSLVTIAKSVCKKNVAFFFFGTNDGRFAKELPEYSDLINFSNKPSTIFTNLIDTLDYRRLNQNQNSI